MARRNDIGGDLISNRHEFMISGYYQGSSTTQLPHFKPPRSNAHPFIESECMSPWSRSAFSWIGEGPPRGHGDERVRGPALPVIEVPAF